jgi:myo-inositol-1(or 4)-monophosphatase
MGHPMPEPDPSELLELAVTVARRAADLARTQRLRGVGEVGTKSTDTDLVTAADRAVERLIGELLRARRPDDLVLGEEFGVLRQETNSGSHGGGSPGRGTHGGGTHGGGSPGGGTRGGGARGGGPTGRVRWVVDPIDGTVNYVYGIPHYAVSIAAEVDGIAVAGVVRNAETGEEWTAVRGQGAWRAGVRLAGSSVTRLDQALVATGFAYDAARRAHRAGVLVHVIPLIRDIRRFGAAALDLCAAADGRVDAYFEKGLGAWDHAAGGLIAYEAGLRVSGLRGAPPGPGLVLAAPVGLYQQLHDLLVTLDADGGP